MQQVYQVVSCLFDQDKLCWPHGKLLQSSRTAKCTTYGPLNLSDNIDKEEMEDILKIIKENKAAKETQAQRED